MIRLAALTGMILAILCLEVITSAYAGSRSLVGPAARAAMINAIRRDLQKAAPAADDQRMEEILTIIGKLPRERFVPAEAESLAYHDVPVQIGYGQTISDPYIVAIMTAALQIPRGANVLDVGTGSGYQAAVLSSLAARVSSIEILAPLAQQADQRLRALGYCNTEIRAADGFAGWPEHAPFDGIIVAAGAAKIPGPLLDQLKPGARIVMPIGPSTFQEQLVVVTKASNGMISQCSLGVTGFVPFTGIGQRPPGMRGLIDRTIPLCYGVPIT